MTARSAATALRFDEPPEEAGISSSRRLHALRAVTSMVSANGWLALGLALALAVLALVLGYVELAVIAGSFVMAWLIAVVVALRPSAVVAQRFIVPARVKEGEQAQGLLTITNSGRVRAPPAVATEAFDGRDFPIPLPSIPARSEHVCSYTVTTSRRGRHRVGPLRISRADPFGFVRAATAGGPLAQLVVHPRVYDVPPLRSGRVRDLEGAQQSRRAQGGVAFHHLREYVPGDDRRLIHWRSSAKLDTLLVRHNVVTHEPSLAIVLDTSPVYSDAEAFDDAVRVAASLVVAGVQGGFPTSLHTTSGYGGAVELNGDGLIRVLDLLAVVRTGSDDPGLSYLAGVSSGGRAETSLGVVTGLPAAQQLGRISRVSSRFDTVSTILIGDRLDRTAPAIAGSFVMRAPTADDWARLWKSRFG
ncbi:MAG: DUF58 domain-containing protein [Acidimicrobiales bacterium]